MILRKQLPDGRYVFDKDGVIFCATEDQVFTMLKLIHGNDAVQRHTKLDKLVEALDDDSKAIMLCILNCVSTDNLDIMYTKFITPILTRRNR